MEAHLRNGRSTGQPHPAAEPFFQCQDRFQLLVESMPDPVVMYDLEGRVSFVNDSFTRTYGWSLDELAGRRLDFVPPHEREKTKAMLDEARTMDRLYLVFQTQRLTKDGRLLDIELRGSAIRDRAGRVVGTMAVHVDHTEKLRAEKALSESEERYRKVLEASPDAVAVYDQSGRITYLNPAFEQTFGWNLEDLMGKGIDFVPEHEKKKTYEAVMRTLKGENVLLESQRLTRDGRLLDIQLKTAIFLDAEGKLAGDVVIYRDITEKKRAEEALRRHRDHLEDLVGERTRDLEAAQNRYRALYEAAKKAEELYRSLFEASADAIVVYDLDGLTRYLNPAFTQAFGWTLAEVIGRKIPFVPDEEQATTLARVNEIIQGGAARRNFETRRLTKDGRVLEVNISASRYHDHEGRPAGLLVLLRDVTETKRTETELTRARGRMQNVIDSMPSLLVGVDRDLRVTYWNAQATRETGLGPGLAKGLPVRNVLPILEPYLALVRECLEEGRPRKAERIRPGVPGDRP
jgi:PAS domain S-box-containing protein